MPGQLMAGSQKVGRWFGAISCDIRGLLLAPLFEPGSSATQGVGIGGINTYEQFKNMDNNMVLVSALPFCSVL